MSPKSRANGRVLKIESGSKEAPTLEHQWPGIKVVAHRGGVGLVVPENTLVTNQKAIEVGAQLVELMYVKPRTATSF